MAEHWYSHKPRTRFSKEHRENLPVDAKMIDVDQVLWVLYDPDNEPLMLVEVKPPHAREDFWPITRRLAQMAGLPAAKVIEQRDGTYTVFVATDKTDWEPHHVGDGLTIQDWYNRVEAPLRKRLLVLAA